jgi:hypothetical protein
MKAILFTVILAAGALFAASGWYFSTQHESEPASQAGSSIGFDTNQSAENRIAALEQAVSDERRTPVAWTKTRLQSTHLDQSRAQ